MNGSPNHLSKLALVFEYHLLLLSVLQLIILCQLHSYVLPIMQGYYQIAKFHIPRQPEATEEGATAEVDYILISRRSRDRAGLRYQRRGIDEDANVANFVETEAIMRVDVSLMSTVIQATRLSS